MFSHIINLFILFFYFIKSNVKTTIPVVSPLLFRFRRPIAYPVISA